MHRIWRERTWVIVKSMCVQDETALKFDENIQIGPGVLKTRADKHSGLAFWATTHVHTVCSHRWKFVRKPIRWIWTGGVHQQFTRYFSSSDHDLRILTNRWTSSYERETNSTSAKTVSLRQLTCLFRYGLRQDECHAGDDVERDQRTSSPPSVSYARSQLLLRSPYVIGQTITFSSCSFFLSSIFLWPPYM